MADLDPPEQGLESGVPADIEAGRPTVRHGLGFAATSFGVNIVVGLVSAVVTARLYGVDVIGEYALVSAPWLTLVQFSTLAEQVALTRRLSVLPPHHPMVPALFVPVLSFSTALTMLAAVPVLLLGAAAMRGPIDRPELVLPSVVIVVGYVLLENTSWNIDALLSAFRAGPELFWSRLTQVAAFLLLSVAAAPMARTVWSLTWATVLSFALALGVRLVLVRRYSSLRPGRELVVAGWRELPVMLRFSLPLVPGRLASGLVGQLPPWVLGSLASVSTVGAYSRAAGLATRMNDAGYRVGEILFPTLVQRHEVGDSDGFVHTQARTVRATALPLFLVAGAGGGAAAGLLEVFGHGFTRAAGALAFLLVAHALFVVTMLLGNGLVAIGRPGSTAVLSLVRLAVLAALMFPMTDRWGGTGLAAALLVAYLAGGAVLVVELERSGLGGVVRALRRPAASIGAATLLSFAVARVADLALAGVVGGAVAAAAGLAVGGVCVVATGGVTAAERSRALVVVGRVRRAVAARAGG